MPRPGGIIGRVSRPDMPVCGQFHVHRALKIWDNFTGAAMRSPLPNRVNTGLPQRSKTALLFDDIVRDGEHAWRNGETEHLGGLEVDDQLDLGRLHDG
jgi:hypothetical protein